MVVFPSLGECCLRRQAGDCGFLHCCGFVLSHSLPRSLFSFHEFAQHPGLHSVSATLPLWFAYTHHMLQDAPVALKSKVRVRKSVLTGVILVNECKFLDKSLFLPFSLYLIEVQTVSE